MKAALLTAIAIVVFACQPEHPVTRYGDPEHKRTKELIASYQLTAVPTREWYYEEESVTLALSVDTLAATKLELFNIPLNLQKQVALWRRFRNVSKELWDGSPPMTDAGTPYLEWSDPDSDGVMYLGLTRYSGPFPPGSYKGFVDLRVTSNWFEFEIKPLPDSVRIFYERVKEVTRTQRDKPPISDLFELLSEVHNRGASAPLAKASISRVLLALTNRKALLTIGAADSTKFVEYAKEFISLPPELDGCNYAIAVALGQLAERRGENWKGRPSLGAYLVDLNDSTLYNVIRLQSLTFYPSSIVRGPFPRKPKNGRFPYGPRELKHLIDRDSEFG